MSNTFDLLHFGDHCRRTYAAEANSLWLLGERRVLRPEEMPVLRERSMRSDSDIAAVCRLKLAIHEDFFTGVRMRLASLQRVWEAVIEEKARYEIGKC